MPSDGKWKSESAQIEAFLQQRRADSFYCPYLRATLTKAQCAEMHKHKVESKWFGQITDALATPQNKFCNACKLGRMHAKQIKRGSDGEQPAGKRRRRASGSTGRSAASAV